MVCGAKFRATRRDARYCSGRCRQRAQRARAEQDDLLRQIQDAKRHYWGLVRRFAEALGVSEAQVLTGEAQVVDEAGNVWIRGEHAGHTAPPENGWARWGLEAAGPPWSPPTDWVHENFGPGRVASDAAYREQLQRIGRRAREAAQDDAPPVTGSLPDCPARSLPDGSDPAAFSGRQFTTVIADPPWQYDNTASRGAAENHYPVMTIGELCELGEVPGFVTARDGPDGLHR